MNSCMLAEDSTEKTLVGLAYPPAVKSSSDEKDDGRFAGRVSTSSVNTSSVMVDSSSATPSRLKFGVAGSLSS